MSIPPMLEEDCVAIESHAELCLNWLRHSRMATMAAMSLRIVARLLSEVRDEYPCDPQFAAFGSIKVVDRVGT
jgi:hypothetical protein